MQRTTRKMVDFQLDLANERLKRKHKKVSVYNAYGYNHIAITNTINGARDDLRNGLTLGQIYDILYVFNELN